MAYFTGESSFLEASVFTWDTLTDSSFLSWGDLAGEVIYFLGEDFAWDTLTGAVSCFFAFCLSFLDIAEVLAPFQSS